MQLQPKNICCRSSSWASIYSNDGQFETAILSKDETEKSLTALERDILVPCVTDDVITDKDFHQQCPLSRSYNRNNIKKMTEERERERERERISVWDSNPGTSKRKKDHTDSLSYPLD